jgi:hypothetical protein
MEKLQDAGTPLVVVLINTKPLVLPRSVQGAAAILECFNPGMKGGTAVAEILWGKVNPSAKLCVSDEVTSVTWVDKELKAFQRVSLEPGETRTVSLKVPFDGFSLVDADVRRIVEPGAFQILVGGSSRSAGLPRGSC